MEGESSLWLVRHAAVSGRKGTIHPLDAPADLSDHTRLEALRRHLPCDAASYASPARRTIDTARALRIDPVLVPEFGEQDFGDWTGRRHDDLAVSGSANYARFWKDPARSKPPGGESFEDQVTRVRQGLLKIERSGNARNPFGNHSGGALHRARHHPNGRIALRYPTAVDYPHRSLAEWMEGHVRQSRSLRRF